MHPSLCKRSIPLVVAAMVLGGACVDQGDPGVSVSPLKADIVFGVRELTPPAAPANVAFTEPEVFGQEEQTFDEKVLELPPVTPLPAARPTTSSVASDCPTAALTAFPKETAEVTVVGTPNPGVYRFKRSIALTDGAGRTQTSTGFEERVVRRVTPHATKSYEFTYQVVQPNYLGTGGFVATTYRVNSNPEVIQNVNRPPQTIGVVPTPGVEYIVTPPNDEPGIFVDKVEVLNGEGQVNSSFEPMRPVKYLPLDEGILKAGQTWTSIGIDPLSGQSLVHEGTVVRKTRVDACGEIVEGWLIEATQTFSDGLTERKFFYNIATQDGAMFIADTTQFSDESGRPQVLDFSLAKVEPRPIPQHLQ